MSLDFLRPAEHFGRKFDRGMVLFEFDALREPERTQFPQIGAWLRERVPMVEVPTPQMLWKGRLWPDLFISNQLEALSDSKFGEGYRGRSIVADEDKRKWSNELDLESISIHNHGLHFHAEFIAPMCRKITGMSSREISAKFHRAAWLPIYHAETLRTRASIATPFYYPAAGFAGDVQRVVQDCGAAIPNRSQEHGQVGRLADGEGAATVALSTAFALVEPRRLFSVLFVVDESPIYRITNMDATNALCPHEQRWVIEYRGECNVPLELERLQLGHYPQQIAYDSFRMTIPSIANVNSGWRPRPNINEQLMEVMRAEA